MNKFFLVLAFFTFLLVGTHSALAENYYDESILGVYVEPKIGVDAMMGSYLERSGRNENAGFGSNASIAGALSIGYDFWYVYDVPVRLEGEYSIRSTAHFDHDGETVKAVAPQTIFANVYYDYHNETDFTPYIGGGVGAAFVGTESNFAWNAGTGVAYSITDNLKASLGYRFVSFGQFEDRNTTGVLYSHEALLGLRYTF